MYDFATLVRFYPAWPLSEVKALPYRERQFWIELGIWNNTPTPKG
jgi:hypothetical protein